MTKKPTSPPRSRTKGPVGVGVIGLGFMGTTHLTAYGGARAAGYGNRIVAVCDRSFGSGRRGTKGKINRGNLVWGQGRTALFDPHSTARYSEADALLADDKVELVSICTHTPTHVDLAIAALKAGKHVLVEKPVAITSSALRRLARAAQKSDRICMPAMCIRFWPAWRWLRDAIRRGNYGPVKSAVFRRIAAHPSWSKGFYADTAVSGGALFDLHIHDADFVRFCFGPPAAVQSTGSSDHVTTLYRYPNGPRHVVAEGGWDLDPGFGFEMNFTVVFERASADFRLGREKPLVLWKGNRASHPRLPAWDGYEGEVRHILSLIRGRTEVLEATAEEAVALTRMLEAEQKSIATGRPVRVTG